MKLNYFRITTLALVGFVAGLAVGSVSDNLGKFAKSSVKSVLKTAGYSDPKWSKPRSELKALNVYWANQIVRGGYILHIRHAMREKFTGSVYTYDAIELLNNEDARNTDYYRAVCLTERGILDSKAVGKVFELAKIKISYVVSSPSCRARETAIYAFNRIDQIEPSILHRSAQPRSQHKAAGQEFRKVIDNIEISDGSNIIISGHGGTLGYDIKNNVGIVDIDETHAPIDERNETGIVVIERSNGNYIARHMYNSINQLSTSLLNLPLENNKNLDKFLFYKGDSYKPKNINKGFIYNQGD